jgi:hypothetical protein
MKVLQAWVTVPDVAKAIVTVANDFLRNTSAACIAARWPG